MRSDFAELREQGQCLPADEQTDARCRKLVEQAQAEVEELTGGE